MKNGITSSVSKRNHFSLKFIGLLLLFLGLSVSEGWGQILTFDFIGLAGTEATSSSNTNNANINTSIISRGNGLTSSTNGDRFNSTGWATVSISNAISGNDYVEFTISPKSNYQFSVSSIVVQWQRSGTGNTAVSLRSSIDSYATDLDAIKSITDNTSTQTLTWTFSQSNSSNSVTYRLYSYAEVATGTGGPGDGTGNDITVNGTVTSSGSTPPTLTADATLNTVDNNIDITFPEDAIWRGLVSAVKVGGTPLTPTTDYVLSNGNLQLKPSGGNSLLRTAGSKTVTVEASGYTVATVTQAINAGVANKLTMKTQPTAPASNGAALATQPAVYIQDQYGNATTSTATITATVGSGAWTLGGTNAVAAIAGTVTFSGLTATSAAAVTGATISFTGDGLTGISSTGFNIPTPPPTITVTSLVGFGSITVNSTSTELSYTVSAEHLTENLVITPPVGFEVSTTSGSGFVSNPSTLTLTQTGGTISPTTIFVRFNPAIVQVYSAIITHTSGGATTKNVAVSGTATATAAPTAATATDITDISFTANWGTVSGASGYKFDVSTSPFGASVNATDLFFSEYIEGSSNNKYIEIYNGTGSTVDLSNYKLQFYANGNPTAQNDVTLSGTIANGSTVVYKNTSAAIFSGTAIVNAAVLFSGNDAVVLYKISTSSYVDIFGKIGEDPGTAWTSGSLTTLAKTLTRKSTVTSGISTNPASGFPTLSTEWDQYNVDDVSNLGTHAYSGANPSVLSGYNNLSVSGASQAVTGLTGNTTYYYRVRSTAGGSTSANSNTITVLTAPSAPIASEETDNTFTSFIATWTLPAGGATSYALDVSENNSFSSFLSGYENLAITGTSQVVSGLSPNTTYYYRVKATNATATAISNTITAATNNNIVVSIPTNASTLIYCPTCDVTVLSGASLTLNESRTFNSVTVNPTGQLTNNSGNNLTTGTLNLNSDVTGTATFVDNGNIAITTINVQQYLASARNWYLSSPLSNAKVKPGYTYYHYNEPNGSIATNWTSPTTGDNLTKGRGYIVKTTSADTYTFNTNDGTLNNGNISCAVSRTNGVNKSGFNLIGNPYPAYANWNSISRTDVESTIWYRTKNGSGTYVFDTYNGIGTNNNGSGAVTEMIPPMQAFWVRVAVNKTSGSVLFTNDMRAHESGTNRLKAPSVNNQLQILRLQVSNAANSDEAIIVFNDNASNALDTYDSPKMTNSNNTIPEIYSLIGNEELVINGMNSYSSTTEIPVGFRTGATNNFSIKATEVSNFKDGTQIILKDNELTTETDITNGTPYTFASDAASAPNRFSIIFRNSSITTGIDHNQANDKSISVYRNSNSRIVINCSSDIVGNGNVSVYNAIGQKLTFKAINSTSTVLEQSYTAGVYFVSVVANGKTITRKVIVD